MKASFTTINMLAKAFLPEDHGYYTKQLNFRCYELAFKRYYDGLDTAFDALDAQHESAEAMAEDVLELCRSYIGRRIFKKLPEFDLAQFLLFYTLPAALEHDSEKSRRFAEALANKWNSRYSGERLSCCTHRELAGGFGNRIFGFEIK